jgi:hypothetical protein
MIDKKTKYIDIVVDGLFSKSIFTKTDMYYGGGCVEFTFSLTGNLDYMVLLGTYALDLLEVGYDKLHMGFHSYQKDFIKECCDNYGVDGYEELSEIWDKLRTKIIMTHYVK